MTHIKGKAVKDMLGFHGRVWRSEIPTSGVVSLTVRRVCHIPSVEELSEKSLVFICIYYNSPHSYFNFSNVYYILYQIFTERCFFDEGHGSKSFKLAAVFCTSKDLEECATFLGVSVEGGAGYGSKKVSFT